MLFASSRDSDRRDPVKRGYSRARGHGNSTRDPDGGIKLNEDGRQTSLVIRPPPTFHLLQYEASPYPR